MSAPHWTAPAVAQIAPGQPDRDGSKILAQLEAGWARTMQTPHRSAPLLAASDGAIRAALKKAGAV
jgi:hypothetical protein